MKILAKIKKIIEVVKKKASKIYKKATFFIKKRPLGSFGIVLSLLLVILIVGNVLQKTKVEKTKELPAKAVTIYSIGEAPSASFQAKIEKSGVVKIIAQAPGIVQSVNVTEGSNVYKGQQIISLASNYQGGNAASVQRQIAQIQYQNVLDTFDNQKDLLNKQRDIANTGNDSAGKLRDISRQSLGETNSLVSANQAVLDQMNQNLQTMILANPNDPNILTLKSSINQLQGGINQLREAARSIDYSTSNDNAPAQLANKQKDMTLKQLDVQDKSLDMSKEISSLQLSLAYINEATMYPASPFSGTVERIYVYPGQSVNPGTVLAVISSQDIKATAVLTVPAKIASILTHGAPSEIEVNNKKIALTPYYISSQATDGQLFSVFYDLPEETQKDFSDGQYIDIRVPINSVDTTASDPLLPIDAVYQTQDQAFVLVDEKGTAVTRTVKIGQIYGSYIEVLSGLKLSDQVILDRNVIAGDKVTIH